MNLELHLRIAGVLLLTLGLAHGPFHRFFKWTEELQRVSLLTRQVFVVHEFFIALVLVMMGTVSIVWWRELVTSGVLSRVVLGGLVLFWALRLGCQLFVYDAAIWRGQRFYTLMHVLFSLFWTYLVAVFGRALWVSSV